MGNAIERLTKQHTFAIKN